MTTAKILRILGVLYLGLVTGNYSLGITTSLLRSVVISGKIRKHYENLPNSEKRF